MITGPTCDTELMLAERIRRQKIYAVEVDDEGRGYPSGQPVLPGGKNFVPAIRPRLPAFRMVAAAVAAGSGHRARNDRPQSASHRPHRDAGRDGLPRSPSSNERIEAGEKVGDLRVSTAR